MVQNYLEKKLFCVLQVVLLHTNQLSLLDILMRHGADVTCVASEAATKLIKPDYFKWATGNEVVSKLTGKFRTHTSCRLQTI